MDLPPRFLVVLRGPGDAGPAPDALFFDGLALTFDGLALTFTAS